MHPQGVSAVSVLTESHMSVHTWPELGYAAFDIFTCGPTQPMDAVAYLSKVRKTRAGGRARSEAPPSVQVAMFAAKRSER
jgi:S-adenosylmethionine decarboxylase proenzyme